MKRRRVEKDMTMTNVRNPCVPPPSKNQGNDAANPKAELHHQLLCRRPSLTPVEMAFLSALLIDPPNATKTAATTTKTQLTKESLNHETTKTVPSPEISDAEHIQAVKSATQVLSDDMLFSLPPGGISMKKEEKKLPNVIKKPKDYRFLVGLWQAHHDGVSPRRLTNLYLQKNAQDSLQHSNGEKEKDAPPTEDKVEDDAARPDANDDSDEDSVKSDVEVRRDESDDLSDVSWEDETMKNFDAWQVLKDEYAKDYGFDYSPDGTWPTDDDNELEPNTFKILGTSAEDQDAHPHVLSPPLIDAILNFAPDHLKGQNLWMKYSLVRDGASLDTFKQYARASKDTILAIETTKGHVFGCFVSQPWRTAPTFYGGSPSFVFKMRHNRNTPVHSLMEQAQLEGEIDVYFLLQDGQLPQVCTHDTIGVGEGALQTYDSEGNVIETVDEKNYGFAIALTDDLLTGTTSKCSSYKNPCLVDPNSYGEPFEVLNLELWTLTPCFSLESAEKLEMTQFFVRQSVHNMSMMSSSSIKTNQSQFTSRDLDHNQFYRRVGHGDDHEEIREQWQYRNMMDGGGGTKRGIGSGTPRFNNSTS